MGANPADCVQTSEELKQPSLCPAKKWSHDQQLLCCMKLVSLWHAPALPLPLCCFIFFRSSLFLSAVGVSAKEAHMQCVSDSAEILMVPGVGGWYRACIVTVQRVPSRHQALLAKLLNEQMDIACALSSCLLLCFCTKHQTTLPSSQQFPTHTLSGYFRRGFTRARAHARVRELRYAVVLSVGGQRGGLCYQFILCGLGYKKHPVL